MEEEKPTRTPQPNIFSTYWQLLKGQRTRFITASIIRVSSDLSMFANAFYLGLIIDLITMGATIKVIAILCLVMTLTGAAGVWLRFTSKRHIKIIGANLRQSTRLRAMKFLIQQDLTWHEKEETGAKIQRINQGADQIFEGLSHYVNEITFIATSIIGGIAVFAFLDPIYLVYSLSYTLIYLGGEVYFNKRLSSLQLKLNKIREQVSGKFHESAHNLLTVKSMNLQDHVTNTTSKYEQEFYQVWEQTLLANQQKSKTIKIFAVAGYAGFILLVAQSAIEGAITIGAIMTYTMYYSRIRQALDNLTNNINKIIKVKAGIERFVPFLHLKAASNKKPAPKNWETLEFKNVSFAYKEDMVLKNVSFSIRKGEKIGIKGKTGGGKSTMIKLLLGLYKPSKGKILIDGKDLNSFEQDSRANLFGVVLQETELFNSPLIENITLGNGNKEKLNTVIKQAQLAEVIKKLPLGINTPVGEKGYRLSGGERQRVGIARALYRQPSILLLDEATSALDSKTELKIQRSLEEMNITTIMIAHRLSTLEKTQRILTLQRGRISTI